MNARTQAMVLLLFGAALLRLGLSDLLLRFVRASARPWVLTAGAVFVVLAVWSLVADARQDGSARHGQDESARHGQDESARHGQDESARHGQEEHVDAHGHGAATRLAWLVIAPVVAVLVIAPQALGAFTADRQSSVVAAAKGTERQPPLGPGDPVDVSIYDVAVRAILGGGTTLQNRTVRFTAFVARGSAGEFTAARLIITCCAADASPVFVQVQDPGRTAVRRNGWVQVTARYVGVSATDRDLPVVRASVVRAVAAPSDPYV